MFRDDVDEVFSPIPYATVTTEQLIPAVAYARVSTRSKDQKNSFENQQKIFTEQAMKMGYYLVPECGKNGIYADRGISGKSLKKRDQFNKMMADAPKGLFKQVLTTNIARYARDVVTLQSTVRELRKNDIGVYFLKENINTGDYAKTYGEEVMLNILGSLAQNELVQLSKGIQIGMRQAQRDGKWTSQPPYGYDRIDGFLKINEDEAKIVKQIYKWYTEDGFSFYKMANNLNSPEYNIPSKKGGKWQESSIRKMIDNPIYIGDQINYQTMMLDIFTDKIEVIDDNERIKHHFEHLRIVDDEVFEKAQIQKKKRAELKTVNKVRYSNANVLSNLFYCGNCGASMKKSQKDNNVYYICSRRAKNGKYQCEHYNYIRENEIIEYLIKKIIENDFSDSKIVKRYYDWYIDNNLGKNFIKQLPDVIAKIDKLENRKQGYLDMKADKIISKEDFNKQMKRIEEQLKPLLLTKKRIDNINAEIKEIYATYDYFIDAIKNFSENNISNQLLRKIFKRITITTDQNGIKHIDEPEWNNGLDKSFNEIADEYYKSKLRAD